MKTTIQQSLVTLALGAALLFNAPVNAGSTQFEESKFAAPQISKFAKQVEHYAAAQQANVFIIGRVGQPKKDLPKGFEFTHVALAVYSEITTDDGAKKKGYAIHNLYQYEDDLSKSSLVIDYPTDFFWSVYELEAGIAVPVPKLQAQIINAINNGVPAAVHNSRYSLIANPFNAERQNCTEHTLDVINASIYNTTDIAQLKANAKSYFKPQPVKVNPFKLMLGNMFKDDIFTSDHSGDIEVASFMSIMRYLREQELLAHAAIITPDSEKVL
ncbi:DUF2145 domain-containing protein [Flocculibacter collagenilyticus]|uniref:DUF2145 domain-containing protein n=1 Tax=Flocculibacter collagenilyticus TaxID=2744479 RepID=UPI0018F4C1BF|nr:DUF2145 domain-containing protein [Flocculibacter collagenilyticus]